MRNDSRRNVISIIVFTICSILSIFTGVFLANKMNDEILNDTTKELIETEKPETINHLNFLLLGLDGDGTRSDIIMFLTYNGKTKKINVLSIPRDTRVVIGNKYQKINAAIGIGQQETKKTKISEPEEMAIKKVKEIIKLPVHFFITLDFKGFRNIVDLLDGVDFDVPDIEGNGRGMNYEDRYQKLKIHLKPGLQHLNGAQAEGLVRYRSGYADADIGRIQTQQSFLKEFARQKLRPHYITRTKSIYEEAKKYMRTNYTLYDLAKHISVIRQLKYENIEMFKLPGEPKTLNRISYFIPNPKEIDKLIKEKFKD